MKIFYENKNSDLIDDMENSESSQVEGSAVTREDHKPVDPVLDGLVESLKKDSEGTGLSHECDLKSSGGGERRTVGSSASSRCQSQYCGHQWNQPLSKSISRQKGGSLFEADRSWGRSWREPACQSSAR